MQNEYISPVLQKLVIKNPNPRVKMSDKQRARYYKMSSPSKIPLKYFAGKGEERKQNKKDLVLKEGYYWDTWKKSKAMRKALLLFDENGDRVVANPNKIGQPKYHYVTGQEFSKVGISFGQRIKIVDGMIEYLSDFVNDQLDVFEDHQFPLVVKWYYIFDPKTRFDLDNMWWWWKMLSDTIVHCNKIPDDDYTHITGPGNSCRLIPKKGAKPKFIWTFHSDISPAVCKVRDFWFE